MPLATFTPEPYPVPPPDGITEADGMDFASTHRPMTARWFLPALSLAALLLMGCGGGGTPDTPELVSAVSERVVSGTGEQSSTVTLRFDRDLDIPRGRVPLASRIEIDVPHIAEGETRRVLVASVETRSDRLVVQVNDLVPDGARVRIDRRAFDDRASGEIEAEVTSDLSPAFALLATVTLQPSLPGLLDEPQVPPVAAADRDPAAMRQLLDDHLSMRGTNAELRAQALDTYDSIPTDIVPSPKLRAALAALVGTFATNAAASLLTDDNCTRQPAALIAFQPPPELPDLLGRSTRAENGARVISINPVAEGDRLEHLMPLLAHEAIHCDRVSGRYEEIASTAFDTFLYLQLIAVDPTLVEANTPLARDLNVDAIAMINSGRFVPESVGVLQSPNVTQAVPGSTSRAASFGDLVLTAYQSLEFNDSPSEPLANEYAVALAQVAGMGPGTPFNLAYLDELLGRAMPGGVLAAAILAFQMEPVR
jgi:hypothetical protein